MKNDTPVAEAEVEKVLEDGRTIRRVPDVVRARALARARATVVAEAARKPMLPPAEASMIVAGAGRGRGRRVAIAACVALVLGAAGAGAAWRVWTPQAIEPLSRPSSPTSSRPRAPAAEVAAPSPPSPAPNPTPPARPHHLARPVTPQESYRAELDLLQRANVAYAARDFSGALVLVAAHARRFPNGRLAEEREALRIRSLAGSGRGDEARHAASQFAVRFPRSVLLPRLRQTVLVGE
jgi:hypothetical protein